MTYAEFRARRSFDREELLAFADGKLVVDAPARFRSKLPTPPMLMVDRILELEARGHRGRIVAERDVSPADWYFACHFVGDPVQPGCLGVDGMWQLLGFFCAWKGALGTGRALGAGEIEFTGQIRPRHKLVRYEIDVVRYSELPTSGSTLVIGDGKLLCDGEAIYAMRRAKVDIFQNIEYPPS